MVKKAAVLGSTGSVGTQALEVMRALGIKAALLSAGTNEKLLADQCREFLPDECVIASKDRYASLRLLLADTPVKVSAGEEELCRAARDCDCETVLNSVVGIRGLLPTLAAISGGKDIALANKETLVAYGSSVMRLAREQGVDIIPVDSEHSAIYQCLRGEDRGAVRRLLLTASGGPFYGKTREFLSKATPAQALRHPSWSMGAKITVDSATLMNKGLEIIEAAHLFGLPQSRIEVAVHRESIVHSMAEFADGVVKAQLSRPDMRLCIQYAFTCPQRTCSLAGTLDFSDLSLTFRAPDTETFVLLDEARRAFDRGGNACAALNGANEAAVALFLDGKIGFTDIFDLVCAAAESVRYIADPTLEDILETDREAREFVNGGRTWIQS